MNSVRAIVMEQAAIRLQKLAPLSATEIDTLLKSAKVCQQVDGGREIFAEGQQVAAPQILLGGWAYRTRIFHDGRRQIVGFFLPGDLIGMCRHRMPLAQTMVAALTSVSLCPAPSAVPGSGLSEAYAVSAALDDAYNLSHITRLGRMTAYERLADWLLEIGYRLDLAGLVNGTSFPLPVTQEMLADTLGLTSVHVNRTLQAMRRDGLLELRGGKATLLDRARLVTLVDWRRPTITAANAQAPLRQGNG